MNEVMELVDRLPDRECVALLYAVSMRLERGNLTATEFREMVLQKAEKVEMERIESASFFDSDR